MTIRYRRGMTLGEFEDMIAQHRRDEEEAKRYRIPAELLAECDHPFERLTTEIHGRRVEGGVRITVDYGCGECGEFLGHERKAFKV